MAARSGGDYYDEEDEDFLDAREDFFQEVYNDTENEPELIDRLFADHQGQRRVETSVQEEHDARSGQFEHEQSDLEPKQQGPRQNDAEHVQECQEDKERQVQEGREDTEHLTSLGAASPTNGAESIQKQSAGGAGHGFNDSLLEDIGMEDIFSNDDMDLPSAGTDPNDGSGLPDSNCPKDSFAEDPNISNAGHTNLGNDTSATQIGHQSPSQEARRAKRGRPAKLTPVSSKGKRGEKGGGSGTRGGRGGGSTARGGRGGNGQRGVAHPEVESGAAKMTSSSLHMAPPGMVRVPGPFLGGSFVPQVQSGPGPWVPGTNVTAFPSAQGVVFPSTQGPSPSQMFSGMSPFFPQRGFSYLSPPTQTPLPQPIPENARPYSHTMGSNNAFPSSQTLQTGVYPCVPHHMYPASLQPFQSFQSPRPQDPYVPQFCNQPSTQPRPPHHSHRVGRGAPGKERRCRKCGELLKGGCKCQKNKDALEEDP